MPTLTKSKYTQGLTCPRLLWCIYNKPELIPEIDEETQALFEQGKEIGDLAKTLYPEGIEVERNDNSIKVTQALLKQKKTIFEASFSYKNSYCKTDILIPAGREWDLIEVKSSAKVKDEHLPDVAFQKYCMEGAGIKVRRCYLMHVNTEYARKGDINAKKLLAMEEITKDVEGLVPEVESNINRMLEIIQSKKMPKPELGAECLDPKDCPVCLNDLPEHNIAELYSFGKKAWPFMNKGVVLIKDLPQDCKLNDKQEIQKKCVLSGKAYANPKAISQFLKKLKYPLHALDFETFAPAIPLFDNTRPYKAVPFQLSLHILEKKGNLRHVEYLVEGPIDPRPGILKALKEIGPKGTVLAWNMGFEFKIIESLLETYPKEKWLESILDRLDDPIKVFRNFDYYHPKQHGSCSLKAVLPALTGKGYDGLEVSNGNEAARRFLDMTYKKKVTDKDSLRKALLEYCKQDTQAVLDILMVLVHNATTL